MTQMNGRIISMQYSNNELLNNMKESYVKKSLISVSA